jgi:hypothetical protein
MAQAEPLGKMETALVWASGVIPVTPNALRSAPITPTTAVPWLRHPRSVLWVPPTTPPWFRRRSSCVNRHAPSMSITRTPAPPPPGTVHA